MTSIDSDWGLYPWFEEHGEEFVHPADVANFRQLSPYGKVFQRISADEPYIILRYGDRHFRVKPDLFQSVPAPSFGFGQQVSLKSGGKTIQGKISDIQWHHKDTKPFFHVSLECRPLKKRYWADDLRPVKE
jgi:hypothetical protein